MTRSTKILRNSVLSAALLASFAAVSPLNAQGLGPQMQTCSLMEVSYDGDRAMSYTLPCNAGEWSLTYTGSVPAGLGRTQANYRLQVTHPSGAGFTLNRTIVLPSSAHLGQALHREAVLLADGDLALSDCKKAGCTSYKPLGAQGKLVSAQNGQIGAAVVPPAKSTTPATITVPPLVQQLSQDKELLSAELKKTKDQLNAKTLEAQDYSAQLAQARIEVDQLKANTAQLSAQLSDQAQRHQAEKAQLLATASGSSNYDALLAQVSALQLKLDEQAATHQAEKAQWQEALKLALESHAPVKLDVSATGAAQPAVVETLSVKTSAPVTATAPAAADKLKDEQAKARYAQEKPKSYQPDANAEHTLEVIEVAPNQFIRIRTFLM